MIPLPLPKTVNFGLTINVPNAISKDHFVPIINQITIRFLVGTEAH